MINYFKITEPNLPEIASAFVITSKVMTLTEIRDVAKASSESLIRSLTELEILNILEKHLPDQFKVV
jgi:DNA-binding transcriptional regulator GbsR (MarR family)